MYILMGLSTFKIFVAHVIFTICACNVFQYRNKDYGGCGGFVQLYRTNNNVACMGLYVNFTTQSYKRFYKEEKF